MNNKNLVTLIFLKENKSKELFRYTTHEILVKELLLELEGFYIPKFLYEIPTSDYEAKRICFVVLNKKAMNYFISLKKNDLEHFIKLILKSKRDLYKKQMHAFSLFNKKIEICYKSKNDNLTFMCRLNLRKYREFISKLCKELNILPMTLKLLYLNSLNKKEIEIGLDDLLNEQEQLGLKKLFRLEDLDDYMYNFIYNTLSSVTSDVFSKTR